MAIVTNDVLQITDMYRVLGEPSMGVFTFIVSEVVGGINYDEVAAAFNTTVITPLLEIQTTSTLHYNINIRNLTNGLDVFDMPINRTGARDTATSTQFEALGFKLVRSTALTRNGSKRPGGIPDDAVINGALTGAYTGRVAALAAAFAADVVAEDGAGAEATLRPVIVGRHPIGTPDAGRYDLSKINPIQSASFMKPTTQNTRKP